MRYSQLQCKDLLELAPRDKKAYEVLENRANEWQTCAVGDAARKLRVSALDLVNFDRQLDKLGIQFMYDIVDRNFKKAKITMNKIEKRVPGVVLKWKRKKGLL